MGARMREIDWSTHPLGPVESWSVSLRVNVKMMLANRFPQLLWWGPDYLCLYNDAYAPILGAKHPAALGEPVRDVWSEVWHVLQPLIDTPFQGGPSSWMEDLAVDLRRHGYPEETHFTIAYSPVPDETAERAIGGVLATVVEITEKIIGERRLGVLKELGGRSMVEAQTAEDACRAAAEVLAAHPMDVPFGLIYLIDSEGKHPRIAGTAGIEEGAGTPELQGERASSRLAALAAGALKTNKLQVIERIGSLFDRVPAGPWSEPPSLAVAIPIPSSQPSQPAGILIAGVSSHIPLDDRYRSFLTLVASQIGAAVNSARSLEEQRERAEALAELDRAKTAFFSNVSHEFRTPLTLMLGPLEEALRQEEEGGNLKSREELLVAHRNALRLLKLVNTLLEFSRIEAGRIDASYEKIDVGAYTSELASGFRSAVERAGLTLRIDLPDEPLLAYVDRDMWEKIVLNLVSNAFKHTFEGSIVVEVRRVGDNLCLQVTDTGVGVPEDQIPHLFERFYRVPNARTRAHEGTGIGLALVQELVGLHGGRIEVTSTQDVGSVFTVSIPLGRAHLPKERVGAARQRASTALGATPYLEEALRWLPGTESATRLAEGKAVALGERILLADDNADMREYVARLLRAQGWVVDAVADGKAALASALRSPPDLVLSDVMMPGLDGFGLLRELRADASTSAIPVILLSARAAEEAKVEGLERGADDYLVKPFSANELVARVGAHLRLSEMRQQALESERIARERAEHAALQAAEANQVKSDFLAVMSHELRTPLNAIGGYAQLMEMEIHGPLTDRQRNDLTRINEAQRHLLAMISKVLNYAKLDAGVEEYDIEDVPLDGVLAICETMTQPQARSKGVSFEYGGCAPEIIMRADAEKVQQVVINLLSNAVKFTDSGGSVTLSCLARKDRVYVQVKDTGRGIAEDQIERVFQPFVQLDPDRSRIRQGTGLGLAISRELAHGMGGNLTVDSVLGEGSTFTLELPRAK